MNKVIEINFSKKDDIHFLIEVDSDNEERINVVPPEGNNQKWYIALICKSIDDIPRMRNEALKQLKIKKAINQG